MARSRREALLVLGFLWSAFVDRHLWVSCRCCGRRVREGSFCPLELSWHRLGLVVAPKCLGCGWPCTGDPREKALRFGGSLGYAICYNCAFRHWPMFRGWWHRA